MSVYYDICTAIGDKVTETLGEKAKELWMIPKLPPVGGIGWPNFFADPRAMVILLNCMVAMGWSAPFLQYDNEPPALVKTLRPNGIWSCTWFKGQCSHTGEAHSMHAAVALASAKALELDSTLIARYELHAKV